MREKAGASFGPGKSEGAQEPDNGKSFMET